MAGEPSAAAAPCKQVRTGQRVGIEFECAVKIFLAGNRFGLGLRQVGAARGLGMPLAQGRCCCRCYMFDAAVGPAGSMAHPATQITVTVLTSKSPCLATAPNVE